MVTNPSTKINAAKKTNVIKDRPSGFFEDDKLKFFDFMEKNTIEKIKMISIIVVIKNLSTRLSAPLYTNLSK